MRRALSASFLLVLLFAGCGDGPTATDLQGVFLVVPEQIAAGAQADVRLINNGDAPVTIGWLPCYLLTDRRVGNRWSEIPRESNSCILPAYTIKKGGSMLFKFGAPLSAGTFRLRTIVAGDSVFSAPFTVR